MPASVLESRALVASSKITTGGSFRRQRAIATLCFSPPDSFKPRSPTRVPHFSGSASMNPLIWACSATLSRSAWEDPNRPYSMLWEMVSLNITVS
mmetsp:Transcript_26723/g.52473  ORF Transcript_26723/g.52473 Transcript_26723/m.52473 type:complete len:95 (-) Transcript_26723:705-989(-)